MGAFLDFCGALNLEKLPAVMQGRAPSTSGELFGVPCSDLMASYFL